MAHRLAVPPRRALCVVAFSWALMAGSESPADAAGRGGVAARRAAPAAPSARARTRPARASSPSRLTPRTASPSTAAATAPSAAPKVKAPSASRAKPRRNAKGALTRDQRYRAARDEVQKAMGPWVPRGAAIEVRVARDQVLVTPNHPVVGRGPIEVVVSPKVPKNAGFFRRLMADLDPRVNRRMMVGVSDRGVGTILSESSNSLLARVSRQIGSVLPMREVLFDVLTSRESRAGLAMALVSLSQIGTNPGVAIGGGVFASQMIMAGTKRRREARSAAMSATVAWIGQRAASKRGYPSLAEAHLKYRSLLTELKPGTTPLSLKKFTAELVLADLTP